MQELKKEQEKQNREKKEKKRKKAPSKKAALAFGEAADVWVSCSGMFVHSSRRVRSQEQGEQEKRPASLLLNLSTPALTSGVSTNTTAEQNTQLIMCSLYKARLTQLYLLGSHRALKYNNANASNISETSTPCCSSPSPKSAILPN